MMTIKPPPPPTPNKRAIADALKAGYPIAAHLSTLSGSKSNKKDSMKLFGIARLGRDAEIRHTASGKQVARLRWHTTTARRAKTAKSRRNGYRHRFGANRPHACSLTDQGHRAFVTLRDVHVEPGHGDYGPRLVGTVADVEFVPKQRDSNTAPANPAPRKPAPAPKSRQF